MTAIPVTGPRVPTAPTAPRPFKFVQSLENGLAVIASFGHDRPRQSVAEVAAVTGLDRSAARRLLLTLKALGYLDSNGRQFWLHPKTLDLGYRYLASLPWWREAQQVIEALAKGLAAPCAVGVLDGEQVVYVAYASAPRFSEFTRAPGTRLPAYASAVGRVLLASLTADQMCDVLGRVVLTRLTHRTVVDPARFASLLQEVAASGFALVDQELEVGLRSLAVPITDRGGRVVAALSVSPQDASVAPDKLTARYLEALREAAQRIGLYLPT